jgi:hypothetical protein
MIYREDNKSDTPEMIQKCLNCDKPECCNCYGTKDGDEPVALKRARKKEKIKGLVELGWTDRRIADFLGFHYSTVQKYRNEVLHLPANPRPIVRRYIIKGGTI